MNAEPSVYPKAPKEERARQSSLSIIVSTTMQGVAKKAIEIHEMDVLLRD